MPPREIALHDRTGRAHRMEVAAGAVQVGGATFRIHRAADGSLHVQGPRITLAWTAVVDDTVWVFADGAVFTFEPPPAAGRRRAVRHAGTLTAPMPATVLSIGVAPGDAVRRGDVLAVLEAMKMELPVRADADGVVTAVNCREGEMVQAGQELVTLE